MLRTSIQLLVLVSFGGALFGQSTTRISVSSEGVPGNAKSSSSRMSDDGRWVLFSSLAKNLHGGSPSNLVMEVWLHDRANGTTQLVSEGLGGVAADHSSYVDGGARHISADGNRVVFASSASNLVPSDVNSTIDVFLRDMATGITSMVSTTPDGWQASGSYPSITSDGALVVFDSAAPLLVHGDVNDCMDVFVKDVTTGAVEIVSVSSSGGGGNLHSYRASISGDGRYVTFVSLASNLVTGDTNGMSDIFLRDRVNGTTERVSVTASGLQANSWSDYAHVSDDGQRVLFWSGASNLVPNDLNAADDMFVRDLAVPTTIRVSVSTNGAEANGKSRPGALSADGRYAAFWSAASNLVLGDANGQPDVFRYDLATGIQELVSRSSTGAQGGATSEEPGLSADGALVFYHSGSTELIAGDGNGVTDVFVTDMASTAQPITNYCTAKPSSGGCVAAIGTSGIASATTGDGFRLSTGNVRPNSNGIFFWGTAPAGLPFGGGTLCVAPPVTRTPVQNTSSGQTPSSTCSGATAFAFTPAYAASFGLGVGTDVYVQFWFRDPGYAPPQNFALTDAVHFRIEP